MIQDAVEQKPRVELIKDWFQNHPPALFVTVLVTFLLVVGIPVGLLANMRIQADNRELAEYGIKQFKEAWEPVYQQELEQASQYVRDHPLPLEEGWRSGFIVRQVATARNNTQNCGVGPTLCWVALVAWEDGTHSVLNSDKDNVVLLKRCYVQGMHIVFNYKAYKDQKNVQTLVRSDEWIQPVDRDCVLAAAFHT